MSRLVIAKALAVVAGGLLLLYLTLPLFGVIVQALEGEWVEQIGQPTVAQAIRLSLTTALLSTALTALLGMPLAYWLARAGHGAGPSSRRCLMCPSCCRQRWLGLPC